jgi:hypothetical protein
MLKQVQHDGVGVEVDPEKSGALLAELRLPLD